MPAVVIPATFRDRSAAMAELPALVSQVSAMAGFVAGYWVAFSGDKGTAIIRFESEEAAQALADFAKRAPAESVVSGNIEVGEVMAHA